MIVRPNPVWARKALESNVRDFRDDIKSSWRRNFLWKILRRC
jgi:hypothetical protein